VSKKILISDDDPVVRSILSAILQSQGFETDAVESGTECIQYIQDHADSLPSVIFLDLLLDDMTGVEVMQEIRKTISEETLPIVILSANSEEEMLEECGGVKAQYFLQKPFVADTINDVLNKVGIS
jgi:putative two-component system response regulator